MKKLLRLLLIAILSGGIQLALAERPRVAKAIPDNGVKGTTPGLRGLRIVFDQAMSPEAWSVVGGGPAFPKFVGKPRWENNRTFVWSWRLEADHGYWLSINSDRFTNFRNVKGEPAVPYPIAFRTGKGMPGDASGQAVDSTTPNEFLKRGTPTFVLGTGGDARADHDIAVQVELVRSTLFPDAPVVTDQTIDVAKGVDAWPARPIIYGGPQVNTVLARLVKELPFRMERGRLKLGEEVFDGDEYRLIAVIPAQARGPRGPGYPEFLLYAGTGSPGIAEINSIEHGTEPILVADAFGRLLSGAWRRTADGQVRPYFSQPRARRIAWRSVRRELKSGSGSNVIVQVRFPAQLQPATEDEDVVAACLRGLARAVQKLEIAQPVSVTVYVYPDRESKRALTGNASDGQADVASQSVHVIRFGSEAGGGIERMLLHEGTHVLSYYAWGAPGTALMGEGLAVWTAGGYGGVSLKTWQSRFRGGSPLVADFLGKGFFSIPEQESYPLAGLFIEAAVRKIGLPQVRDRLFGANAASWETACREAGTTSRELEDAWHKALNPD